MQKAMLSAILVFVLIGISHAFTIPDIPIKIINDTNETDINITIPDIDVTKIPPPDDVARAPVDTVVPEIIDDLLDPSLLNVSIGCNASMVSTVDYDLFFGHSVYIDKPDYLINATMDCHLYGKDEEITQDLDEKLAVLDAIEAELEDVEDDADDLLDDGFDALDCIRQAEHGVEAGPMAGYTGEAYTEIGESHLSATPYDVVLRELKDFHADYKAVHKGRNYTDAALLTLESVVDGLEHYCLQRLCLYPEDKEYFEGLLDGEYDKALHYAGETRRLVDETRGHAQEYHDLKGHYITWENCISMISEEYEAIPELLNYSNMTDEEVVAHFNLSIPVNETPKITPSTAVDKFERVMTVRFELDEVEGPKYVVTSLEKRKLLWFFDVDVEVTTEVSAEDGSIIDEELPFWSFLLTG